jgi:hypothetical protein
LENEKSDGGIHIGNVGGDVTGIDVNGSGNIIGKNISVGSVAVGDQQLQNIAKEYADSLKGFTDALNQQLKANNVPADKVAEVQRNVEEFSKELEGVKPGQESGMIKKTSLKSKLINIAKSVLPILPRTLQVLTAFTPLAPFSGLIGEDTQALIKAVQNEF